MRDKIGSKMAQESPKNISEKRVTLGSNTCAFCGTVEDSVEFENLLYREPERYLEHLLEHHSKY